MQPKVIILCTLFLVLALVIIFGFLINPANSIRRYQNTGYNSHFLSAKDFESYVAQTKKNIESARIKADVDASEQTILNNAPDILLPSSSCPKDANGKYQNGILFIHGFLDSAYSYHLLAKFFQGKCFVVYRVLLPGHGSVPGDLRDVQLEDWQSAVKFGITNLQSKVNNIYLSGFSLGGLLATDAAFNADNHIKALILMSPSYRLKFAYPWVIPVIYHISRFIPRLRWWNYAEDEISVRYESYPVNPVYQIYRAMNHVQNRLSKTPLKIPVMILQSHEDDTVNAQGAIEFLKKNDNVFSRIMWYSQDNETPNHADTRIKNFNATILSERILSMSHLSFSLPASDPIYGMNGSYTDCMIYKRNSPDWQQCKNGDDTYYAEVTKLNLKEHIIRRLTFNPFYENMLKEIQQFLTDVT